METSGAMSSVLQNVVKGVRSLFSRDVKGGERSAGDLGLVVRRRDRREPEERAPSSSARINGDQPVVATGTDLAPTNGQLESVVEADSVALPEHCNTGDRDGDLPAPSTGDVQPFPEPNARGKEVGAANLEG
ncbi:hypothetical protein Bca4012_064916 [Brassica carinata]